MKLLALLLCLISGTASAQSLMFPIATTGCNQSTGAGCTVWTPSQWAAQFMGKQDTLGFTPLSPANNLSDVGTPSTARTNLGLGTMATQGSGTVSITGGTMGGVTNSGNFTLTGNIVGTGANPTLSACGTSPSLTSQSSSLMGTVTVGSGSPMGCTLTFAAAFATAPKCIPVAAVSGMPIHAAVTTRSTAAITITFASVMTNGTVDYTCEQ